jgi:hypothetical protein
MFKLVPSLHLLAVIVIAGCASKASPAPTGQTCNTLQSQASAAILDAANSVQQCTTKADCKPLNEAIAGSECTDCLYLVGTAQVSAAINARATAINQICDAFKSAGCKLIPSGCPALGDLDCIQGKCRTGQPATDPVDGSPSASLACSWPAAFDPAPDAGVGACKAARHYLECSAGADAHLSCLSNDATTCPGSTAAGASNCQDHCNAGEYALSCGAVGPGGPWPDPPSTCRTLPPNPGGITFACCPCGS